MVLLWVKTIQFVCLVSSALEYDVARSEEASLYSRAPDHSFASCFVESPDIAHD